jgi:lipoyl-dependent peroxiredoxin
LPRITRIADISWEGSTARGGGTITGRSGALSELPFTLASRIAEPEGKTSPEELLAAAHASCYCMALSLELSEAGNEPEQLNATATVGFVAGEGVKSSHIVVNGRVAGIDQSQFEEAAKSAGENCPISGALSIPITVDATLED